MRNLIKHSLNYSVVKFRLKRKINFRVVENKARQIAQIICEHKEKLWEILSEYETRHVFDDEVERTLDLLLNIKENKQYFKIRVGSVATFLPKNQPLYAFSCFVIFPSLMADEVVFRIPHSMKNFFPEMLNVLDIKNLFPNVIVSSDERLEFLKKRSALLLDPDSSDNLPVTDAVIFTGTSLHADQLRTIFDKRTLFIANGSGHNPVVIMEDADLNASVEAVVELVLYNQGQDCAAPNSILVQKKILPRFIKALRERLREVKIGDYKDRMNFVGPITDRFELERIAAFLADNYQYLDSTTPGIINIAESLVYPVIIVKPLSTGGNYEELFSPIFFIQPFNKDTDLKNYFENQQYFNNAMYLTLYGTSSYIEHIIDEEVLSKVIHPRDTFLHNKHLHEKGVERGTLPYGGYGYYASSLSINDKVIAKPTLPQRDIYEYVGSIYLNAKGKNSLLLNKEKLTEIKYKNVEKLLKLTRLVEEKETETQNGHIIFLDTNSVVADGRRYIKLSDDNYATILSVPNVQYISGLDPEAITNFTALVNLVKEKSKMSYDDFLAAIYAIPKRNGLNDDQNRELQLKFFKEGYNLLLGKDKGPRLAAFLWDINNEDILGLLDF